MVYLPYVRFEQEEGEGQGPSAFTPNKTIVTPPWNHSHICGENCFVIIIPYSSKKQICSIYRWEKMPTVSRYRLNAERQNDGVLTCHLYGF